MTFSVNNNGNFKPVKNISFKGVKSEYNSANKVVQRFMLPPGLSAENTKLEIADISQIKKDDSLAWEKQNVRTIDFKDQNTLDIDQDELKEAYAYRYVVTDSDGTQHTILDKARTERIDDSDWNIVVNGQNGGVMPYGGSMYHVFIDSEGNYNSKENKIESNPDFIRNHFNKLGGSIKSLIYLLNNTDEFDPYKYIISTPDIGADPTSSHKYWPSNSYQCSNVQDFKDFNWELFKKGKGYVADGAFTSQGIQSPMVQHVLKWGEKSPLYKMLKIDGYMQLGVLPDDSSSEAYKHIGLRLVNPKGDGYNSKKPTYIQLYDDRLASKEQIESNELITSYDTPNSKDHYDIINYQNSVQPYYFEINPDYSRVDAQKVKKFNGKKSILLKDVKTPNFLQFDNFEITKAKNAGGATYWDGNIDIVKMNLSNPVKGTENGFKNARNYLYGVASYWTELVQSDMLLRTAKMSEAEKKELAKVNNVNYDAISTDAKSNVLTQNKTVADYVEEFPMQSMETSTELSAIFLQNEFKNEFYGNGDKDEITKFAEDVITGALPSGSNEEYKAYAVKTLSNTVLRSLFAKTMLPDAVDSNGNVNLDKLKNVTLKSMLAILPSTPAVERGEVVRYMKKGLKNALKDDSFKNSLTANIKSILKDVKLDDFKTAESIVLQGHGGLNWRFDAAKDIGDLDAVRNKSVSFDEIWSGKDGVRDFWTNFIENIKTYNPSAYIISEITDMWGFAHYKDEKGNVHKNPTFDKTGMDDKELERFFLTKTGSTASSNYTNYFNNLSAFVGVDPEHGHNRTKDAGNLQNLKHRVEEFLNSNQANTVILSHSFVNNHDKPTILHTLPLDMGAYLSGDKEGSQDSVSTKAVAVGKAISDAIERTNLDESDKEKLKKQIEYLANGQKSEGSLKNKGRADAFGFLPYEVTIKDLIKMAKIEDEDNSKLWQIHYALMKNPMKLQEGLWEMMNAIPGVPTLYNGTEFAQTGYETPSKNMYLGNRNPILHELKNRDGYKQYYKKMNAISSLYKEPGMSATRNGYAVPLLVSSLSGAEFQSWVDRNKLNYFVEQIESKIDSKSYEDFKNNGDYSDNAIGDYFEIDGSFQNYEHFRKMLETGVLDAVLSNNEFQMWPIFKYDDNGSKTISVITKYNIPKGEFSKDFKPDENTVKAKQIPIMDSSGNSPLEDGTILFRKVYSEKYGKFIDEDKTYTVQDGKIVSQNGEEIIIDDTVLNFYVPTEGQISAKRKAKFH